MDIAKALFQVVIDLCSLLFLLTRSRGKLAAENLFLRKQFAMYQERSKKPGRINYITKLTLIGLSKLFNWKDSLVVVQPKTVVSKYSNEPKVLPFGEYTEPLTC